MTYFSQINMNNEFRFKPQNETSAFKLWITYNRFPNIEQRHFDFEFNLPATKGDTPFSATTSNCPAIGNNKTADCQGDSWGIHFSPDQLKTCKRKAGECTIFVTIQMDSIESGSNDVNYGTNVDISTLGTACPFMPELLCWFLNIV